MSYLSSDHVDASRVAIVPYASRYRADFARITLEWYQEYHFTVELIDECLLSAPEEYVLASGGAIWFATCCEEAIGTIGIKKHAQMQEYELIKLGVRSLHRGQHIGQRLVEAALAHAQSAGAKRVVLYTNSNLRNACRLYRKLGFLEQKPMPDGCPYKKADLCMSLSW